MFGMGMQELLLILLVILLLFGAKRIPEVMRGFGKGVSEFKRGLRDIENEIDKEADKSLKEGEKKEIKGKPS